MLGENIKSLRQKKGYTQEEVATRLHVTRQTISKWEKNYSVPDAELLVRLAEILDVETQDLLSGNVNENIGRTANNNDNEKDQLDEYAKQLARIAEQMALRNRRWSTVLKTIVALIVTCILITVIFSALGVACYSAKPTPSSVTTEVETIDE